MKIAEVREIISHLEGMSWRLCHSKYEPKDVGSSLQVAACILALEAARSLVIAPRFAKDNMNRLFAMHYAEQEISANKELNNLQ